MAKKTSGLIIEYLSLYKNYNYRSTKITITGEKQINGKSHSVKLRFSVNT